MDNLANQIKYDKVSNGKLNVYFLGQAGFVIKTPDGKTVAVDPYLSDCCNRYFGFKRLMPYVLSAGEIDFDYLLISHAHYDHFDPDSVPALMQNGVTKGFFAKDCEKEAKRLNLSKNLTYLDIGDEVCLDGGIKVIAYNCDHGKDTPYALGFIIEAENKKIYVAGDTKYREDYFSSEKVAGADLFIFPINGAFGNMNGAEGAKAASVVKAKLSVPCHYWNFAEHFGDPYSFMAEAKNSGVKYLLMRQGEKITL